MPENQTTDQSIVQLDRYGMPFELAPRIDDPEYRFRDQSQRWLLQMQKKLALIRVPPSGAASIVIAVKHPYAAAYHYFPDDCNGYGLPQSEKQVRSLLRVLADT
jgi:hypothetical protein